MKAIKHYLAALVLIFIALPALTSCGSDDEENPPFMPVKHTNTFVGTTTTWPVNDPTSKYTSTKSVYNVEFDVDAKTAKLIITDADFLEGMPSLNPMTFSGISYTVGESAVILNCASLIPTLDERPMSAFPISDLQAKLVTEKSLDLQFICSYRGTQYVVSFKGYYIDTPFMPIKKENSFVGTTTTWPSDNPDAKYTSTKSVYNVVFDTDNKIANLVITDADFLEGMPSLQPMTFPGISYTVGESAVILNCASLTPTIGGRPFSMFPISGLQAKLVTDTSFDLQFICSYRGTPYVVSFKGRPAE